MQRQQELTYFIARMFQARKWALADIPLVFFASLAGHLTVADYVFAIAATVFCLASIVCWYYMFRAVMRIHGPVYALGHVTVSVILTPVALTGIILIPLLVRGDAKRLSSSFHDSSGKPK